MARPARGVSLSFAGMLVAALALFAIYRVSVVQPMPKPGLIWRTGYPQSVGETIERLRERATLADTEAASHSNDWLSYQDAAGAWLGIGRLTGDPADFAKADASLAGAFRGAVPGAGPHSTLATFEFAVHRLDAALKALDAIGRYAIPDPPASQAEYLAMRGDIAFFRGQTGQAQALQAQALKLSSGPETLCRMAQIQWRTGRLDDADATLARCEASIPMRTPQFVAYIAVQHALIALNRGDWPGALKNFMDAEKIYPGDWKTQLRTGMLRAAIGRSPNAVAAEMESLAQPLTRPEVDDSLANLYRLAGDGPRARQWAERAKLKWQRYVAAFPEAFAGHARDHELTFGDPKAALHYAAIDARNRPYGEPLIGLARAWIANGRSDYALALLAKVDRTGWKSAEAERVRAEALALTGKTEASEDARKAALALDPRAYDPARGYIWLDH